jgi:hypothetical protein
MKNVNVFRAIGWKLKHTIVTTDVFYVLNCMVTVPDHEAIKMLTFCPTWFCLFVCLGVNKASKEGALQRHTRIIIIIL